MKATEIQWTSKENYYFSTTEHTGHYKFLMSMGRYFPCNKNQAIFFVKNRIVLSVLNSKDVEKVESVLNEAGLEGDYRYTKSNIWVRLQNHEDLYKALRVKFIF